MRHGDGYVTMAQAVGEEPYRPLAYVAHVDFDPTDPDEVEVVLLATERDRHDRQAAELRRLRSENEALLDALRRADPDAAEQFEH